jgi:hypothetical protein
MSRKKITKKEPPKKGKQLSAKEWAQIEELWASGEVTLEDLANDFGMNPSYLSVALSKRGIEKGSKADTYKEMYQEKIQEEMISDAAMNIRRIHESKDEHYKYSRTIAKLIFTKIAQAVQNHQPISDVKDEIVTLKNAMAALESARASRWAITGLDREPDAGDEIPVLPIEEFTEEELQAIRREQDAQLGVADVNVDELQKQVDKEDGES